MAKCEDYWVTRAQLREEAAQRSGDAFLRELRKTYARGTEEIQGKIDALYRKYEGKYGLSYADAVQKLTPAEQKA